MIKRLLANPADLNFYYSRILQEFACRTGGGFGRPTAAILLLTNRCNARCLHCQSWKLPKIDNELDTDQWYRFLTELRSWLGPVFVSITGGETLLRKDSIDIAQYAAKLGLWVEFLSNGYILTDVKAEKLVNSGVKRIKISLDGSTADIHDQVRGVTGFYDHAVKALKCLAAYMQKSERHIQIYAKTAVMSINIDDLSNIAHLVKEMGIYGVEFQALEPVYYSDQLRSSNWYQENPLWVNDISRVRAAIDDLQKLKNEGYPIINSTENLEIIRGYFKNPEKLSSIVHSHDYKKKTAKCRAWIGGFQVMPDGGMKMCHWMEPFYNAKAGQIKKAWKKRHRCWKFPCKYVQ